MAETIPRCMSSALIEKLYALAERRCAHFIELQQTGRWNRYYSREAFILQMKQASHLAAQWQYMRNKEEAIVAADAKAAVGAGSQAAVVLVALPGERSLVAAGHGADGA